MKKYRRREVLGGAAAAVTAAGLGGRVVGQPQPGSDSGRVSPAAEHSIHWQSIKGRDLAPGQPGRDYTPVTVPNGQTVPHRIVDGVKVFHLTASEFTHEFAPGLQATCWGYNGLVNATTLEAVEGDTVRIYVTNQLPVPTTVHWHGFILPQGMDGVSGLQQPPIPPGQTWVYQWQIVQHGTFMFHSHHDTMTQEGMGLTGLFIVHPRRPDQAADAEGGLPGGGGASQASGSPVDRDFALMLHEWRIDAGASRPDTNKMTDFNVLTINGKVMPHTDPLVCSLGQHVRIRLGNLSAMDHHPIHFHGHEFFETAVDGYRIPEANQLRKVTVLMGVGQTRDIEFIADNPGDWPIHCHMTHHIMNQMGHEFPNMLGVDTRGFDSAARNLVPGYMTMGQDGMAEMGAPESMGGMQMPVPHNSIPMEKGAGPYGPIGLGGMATVIKIREGLTSYEDPGWYTQPDGTAVRQATSAELRRDGVQP